MECYPELIIDDLWTDICLFLCIKDLLSFRLCCHHSQNITNPKRIRINKYWKLRCIMLCPDIIDYHCKLDYNGPQWYHIFADLHKYIIGCRYHSMCLVLKKLVDPSTGKSIKENQLKQELIQQTSLVRHCLKFLHYDSFVDLTPPNSVDSQQKWFKMRMFWKQLRIIIETDSVSLFKFLFDCKPFTDDMNSIIYDYRFFTYLTEYKTIPQTETINHVTILSVVCKLFSYHYCWKILKYLLLVVKKQVLRLNSNALYFEKIPLFWTLIKHVCNDGSTRCQSDSRWYWGLRLTPEKLKQWAKHHQLSCEWIEKIIQTHLELESKFNGDHDCNQNNINADNNSNYKEFEFDINGKYQYDHATRAQKKQSISGIEMAVSSNRADIAKLLLRYGAVLGIDDVKQKLMQVISRNINNGPMIQILIDKFNIDINNFYVNDKCDTILTFAINCLNPFQTEISQTGYIDKIYYLLENNPTIDIINKHYNSHGKSLFAQAIDKYNSYTVSNLYNFLISKAIKIDKDFHEMIDVDVDVNVDWNVIIDRYINDYNYSGFDTCNHYDNKNEMVSTYLYVCKRFPSNDEMKTYPRNVYKRNIGHCLEKLIKTLIDIKVDITVKDENENKFGSDYINICYDKQFESFKQWVIAQESIAKYFNNLNYGILHVSPNTNNANYMPTFVAKEESRLCASTASAGLCSGSKHGARGTSIVNSVTTLVEVEND